MEAYINWLNSLVNTSKNNFSAFKHANWINTYNSEQYQNQRDNLLKEINNNLLFKDTKPYYKSISDGCKICGEGKWSCLFITNKCNASCFYCPTSQNVDEKPSTQGIDFDDPVAYANYVKHFNFKGVSFSGGEPFLFFDRTLSFLQTIREICSTDIYIWLYTNGILVTKEKLKALANAGLNEIRFDIGATNYNLSQLKLAKGIIPNITVEIPAVPEAKQKVIELLPEMIDAGVTNLNLHQLRLTNYNAEKFINRNYTLICAEKPLVLESELTALEIINFAKEKELKIGINYCSFFFKHRFQKAGFRKQVAKALGIPNENISMNGYIRNLTENEISYKTICFSEKNGNPKQSIINIQGKTYYYNYETLFSESDISPSVWPEIKYLLKNEPQNIPTDSLLFKIWQLEYIEKGLREY